LTTLSPKDNITLQILQLPSQRNWDLKRAAPTSTHKKVVVKLEDDTLLKGYLNPSGLPSAESVDILTPDGEHKEIALAGIKAIYFVADLNQPFEPARKAFLSRPKLEGLWLRLMFRDRQTMEGISSNELLETLDRGVQFTPPDLHGNCLRMFVPRAALAEVKVLGIVGTAKRPPRPAVAIPDQPRLFSE
jgi:hypothetical protein